MSERLKYLFERYFDQIINDDEKSELFELAEQTVEKDTMMQMINWSWNRFDGKGPDVISQQRLDAIFNQIVSEPQISSDKSLRRFFILKTTWLRYAAAILLVLTGIALYYIFSNTTKPKSVVVQNVRSASGKNDVQPGFNRAVLTLSNGQKVELDKDGAEIIKDGASSISNLNGRLNYGADTGSLRSPSSADEVVTVAYNTMATPKGGQYQLTLADGTKVWLNAASSITYPIAFIKKTREVSITGEAYFEVAKNKQKPFIVRTRTDKIIVLGTSFNVNAYDDEATVKTSLVEGSIKIGDTNIRPGQAYEGKKVSTTDLNQDVAWKNGVFNFDNLPAEAALRQLARWYDVDIVYQGKIPNKILGGKMGRNLTLQQALKGLDGIIARFKLEGRLLYVRPL